MLYRETEMADVVVLNDRQKEALALLKTLTASGKVDLKAASVDKRTAGALEARGLVKLKETAKGVFVNVTAKGKKAVN
jgi:hypothetical protein